MSRSAHDELHTYCNGNNRRGVEGRAAPGTPAAGDRKPAGVKCTGAAGEHPPAARRK